MMKEKLIMSDAAIVRDILRKIKSNGSCTLEDLRGWFPEYFTTNASGGPGPGYHPPDDFRQLVKWGLVDAFDGLKSVKLREINDDYISKLTFKLSAFAIRLENTLGISLTASPFFERPQPFNSRKWPYIFMLMPFRPEMDAVFNVVENIASSLTPELKAGRADNEHFHAGKRIIDDIWSGIYHARLIVADCTDNNSNVFYEIGIAHTLGKPTILISQTKDDIKFDLRNLRYIIYENTTEGLKKLEGQLKSNLEEMLRE